MQRLEQSIIRILNANDMTVGTGFVVASHLAVTCAHVVQAAGSNCNQAISMQFPFSQEKQISHVLDTGWASISSDDVAFLQFEYLPKGVVPVILGSALQCEGHSYSSFGYASLADYENRKVNDILDGIVSVREKRKNPMLQLKGEEIDRGLSGSPVLDLQTNRVVGMVSEYKDNERTRFAWATTADTLVALHPQLKLWPETYGPEEFDRYLQYLIEANRLLILPDGREVLLEQVYVSLRADEMSAVERQAEHDLYLEDVALFKQTSQMTITDQYAEYAVLRKVIARNPKMFMLEARNWTRLFGERMQGLLSLAEVVEHHHCVVLLGDPGSGKTTLGKWLILQFAQALRQQETHVLVQADTVNPGTEVNRLFDMGPTRLPVFVRIADYANARWDKKRGDTRVPLKHFLCTHHLNGLPIELSQAAKAIIQSYLEQGRALVILDGLDEVADPGQRRAVMREVKHFIDAQSQIIESKGWTGNQVLLTSRIIGYQFEPLTSLPHYTVEEMDDKAIAAFCYSWMRHIAGSDSIEAKEQAQHLKDAIFDHAHPGIRSLAGNPLLLTILAQVFWSNVQRTLPTKRVLLFEEATHAFYSQREEFWDRVIIPPIRLTRALGAVAAYIHANQVTGFAEEGEVREQLRSILTDPEQVEAVLEAAREVSGFLVARGEGVYGFLHRSLQEYFAARYLTDQPEHVVKNLSNHLLDPAWREPIILAIGIVSQRKYPNGRRYLSEVFDAVLNTPDPTGDFLPHRELLAAAACSECERVPNETSIKITEELLTMLIPRAGRRKSLVLCERIWHAFTALRSSPAKNGVEISLCAAIQDRNFELRYAASELIHQTKWFTSAIARSLVTSWKMFANPGASLLMALNEISYREPDCFQSDFLEFRRAVEGNPSLWEKARNSLEWQAVIRVVYLPPKADFSINEINRDSPLTSLILATLNNISNSDGVNLVSQQFKSLISQPGTAEARDAALVLSALGDTNWIKIYVKNADDTIHRIHSLIISLADFLVRIYLIIRKLAIDIDDVHTNAISLALFKAHAYTFELVSNLDTSKEEKFEGEIIAPSHFNEDFDRDYFSVLQENLNVAQRLAETKDLTQEPNRELYLALSLAIINALSIASEIDSSESYSEHFGIDILDVRDSSIRLAQSLGYTHKLVIPDALYSGTAFDYARELYLGLYQRLANDLNLITNIDSDLDIDPNLGLKGEYDLAHIRDLTLDIEGYIIDDISIRYPFINDESYLGEIIFEEIDDVSITFSNINNILNYNIINEIGDPTIFELFESINTKIQRLERFINASKQTTLVWDEIIEECKERWPLKAEGVENLEKPVPYTADKLLILTADLASLNDIQREHAKKILQTVHKASSLGQATIEKLVEFKYLYSYYPEISSQLDWALKKVIYDTPSWVSRWMDQAESAEGTIIARGILRRMHYITSEVFQVIFEALLKQTMDPQLKIILLKAMSWQARLGQIPKGKRISAQEQLLTWLEQEAEPEIRNAIIQVLGYWQDIWGEVVDALLNLFNHPKLMSDFPALCVALARLSKHDSVIKKIVWRLLYTACPNLEAAAALIRLHISGSSKLDKLQNITALHSLLVEILPSSSQRLIALLDAGADDEIWNDQYHGVIVDAICIHLEHHEDLLPILLVQLEEAFSKEDWSSRRIALAATAGCIEVMPVAVRRAYSGDLESLLVKGVTDGESSTSRRFALNALSYLHTVTDAVIPALLVGCRDTSSVQRETIIAASRFQSIKGKLLPALVTALTSESVSIAFAVTQLLNSLGTAMASEKSNLRQQIIDALVSALKDPRSQREIIIQGIREGKLEDALYTALLRIAGWEV